MRIKFFLLAFSILCLPSFGQGPIVPIGSVGVGGYSGPVISNVQHAFFASGTAGTLSNFSPSPANGNLIYVIEATFGTSTSLCTTPTDTLSTSFTVVASADDGANLITCTWYGVRGSGGTDAVTCHYTSAPSGGFDCWSALITGNASSTPLDTSCKNTSGATTSGTGQNNMPCSTSATPSQGNTLFVGYASAESGTLSNGSLLTFVNLAADNGISYQQTALATITPAVTLNTSGVKFAIQVQSFHK